MLTEPKVVERSEQPYVAAKASVPMSGFGDVMPKLLSEVFASMQAHDIAPAGAPFIKYNVIDMEGQLEIEVGVPVGMPIVGDGRVIGANLPAGLYASLTYIGDYDGLVDANDALQKWAEAKGLRFAMREAEDGDHFDSRLELYLTDPQEQPDPQKWETEVAYLLADA